MIRSSFSQRTMMGFSPCAVQLISFFWPWVARVVFGYEVIIAGTRKRENKTEQGCSSVNWRVWWYKVGFSMSVPPSLSTFNQIKKKMWKSILFSFLCKRTDGPQRELSRKELEVDKVWIQRKPVFICFAAHRATFTIIQYSIFTAHKGTSTNNCSDMWTIKSR